ncbi:tetratricopeptide repeat protein [Oceanicola sp. S124]|uniref:tetratricopeptide repeat protein n=1 Tax=Oceanicola sp. S124 TaxID=1042378 RepID=UPI00025581A5|nr:tetratricopeptide repeat protein [Oceanicola sp. S124]
MSAFNRHLKSVFAVFAAASFLLVPSLGRADDSVTSAGDDRAAPLVSALAEAEPEEARQIVRELQLIWSSSGSSSMDLLLRKGRDAMEREEYDEAVGHFSALIDHAPDFAEAWHLRAMVFFRMEELGLAQADLEQALALNPLNFQAAYGLALVMEETGRIDAAFAGYDAILDLYPAHEAAAEGRQRLVSRVSGSDI